LGAEDHGARTLQPVSGSGNPVGDFTDFENNADFLSSAPTTDHPIEAGRVPTKGGRLNVADEFLRTAHSFLTNLDGTFLWSLLETQFTRLLVPCLPPTTPAQPRLIHWPQKPLELHLNELCRVVHFLLEHLPIDTYPGVCSYHLPRIASHLVTCLTTRIQKSSIAFTSGDVSLPALTIIELSSVLKVLESMIGKILEHVMTMFDRSTVFSVDSVTNETKTASTQPTSTSTSHRDLTVLASIIGYFRQFLAAFCVHILGFSPNKMSNFLESIRLQNSSPGCPEQSIRQFNSIAPDRVIWLDLFAQTCRLLLHLSNFPLLVCDAVESPQSMTASHTLRRDSCDPDKLMQLFKGDLTLSVESGEYYLPEWLVCLLYASTELDCFDLKAVSLYTLLELFAASTSVNGWNVDNKNPTSEVPRAGKMRLILPVLSGRLLTYLIRKTSLFSRVGISLWSYLAPSHSSFHEDAAHLLVRLHQLYPPTPSSLTDGIPPGCPTGIGSSVETYILSQMLSPDLNVQVDAQARFALLWHLIRPSPLSCFHHQTTAVNWNGLPATSCSSQKPVSSMTKSKLTNFAKSIAAPCWRRSPLIVGDRVDASAIHSTHSSGLQSIPFYRCALLLLDNLDVDNPWGPVGSVGTAVCSFATAFSGVDVTESSTATQISGLIRSVLHEQSVQWMCRALRTGQVDRLMAPVLAALLHPATVRISLKARVLLANRWFTQRRGSSNLEQKESESKGADRSSTSAVSFTLSTESVAEDPIKSSTQTTRKSESKNGGDVFDANCQTTDMMSLLQSRLRLITCRSNADQEARAKRLHAARQTMVSELLGDLLSMPLLQPLDASCTDASNSNLAAIEGDLAPTMLPLHEHLVIHLQNHDANQMIYALSRIRAILTIAPNLFLLALSSCSLHGTVASDPVNSPLCLFGLSLAELLTRHRRALAGGNFYGPTNSDEVSQTLQTQSNLLEVVINLCLLIMCSQLPFTSSTQSMVNGSSVHFAPYGNRYEFTENEFRANKCAQKTATEVLELIVMELVNIQNFSGMLDLSGRAERSTLWSSHCPEGPKYTLITGRRLVECTLKNTCLISAVLHCLASALEVAHWPVEAGRWLSTLDAAESASLPMCLRLLLVNELSANLPATFHTVYLCSLIRLTQAVLKLQPWSADRIEATPPRTLMSNTIWPYNNILGSGISPETHVQAPSFPVDQTEAVSLLDPNRLLDIWLKAFISLPACFAREPLFRTACLTVHWDCASVMSSHPSREQGALLLDIMSLALSCPTLTSKINFIAEPSGFTARCDLHPVWYQFVFATLASWGLYTPHLTRIVVSQLCANLSSLTEHAQMYSDLKNSAKSGDLCIPADYTLASLACLQGIYHALLLPGGSTASAAWLRRSSLPDTNQSRGGITAAQVAGFPDSVANVGAMSEVLVGLSKNGTMNNNLKTAIIAADTSNGGNNALTRFDLLFPSPLAVVSTSNVTASFTAADSTNSSEPSVVIAPAAIDGKAEPKLDTQNFSAIFTSRTKDLFNTTGSLTPDTHPLIQAQSELFRLMPTLFRSLALLWDAFNWFPVVACTSKLSQPPEVSWPTVESVPLDHVALMSTLGAPALVRPAMHLLIEPIAIQHPAPFLINFALAWPANLVQLELGASDWSQAQSLSVLQLLTPVRKRQTAVSEASACDNSGPLSLPLLPMQVSLLRLFSGFSSDGTHFGPLMPVSTFVNQLRDLVRRPGNGVSVLLPAPRSSDLQSNTLDSVPAAQNDAKRKRALLKMRLQINLLHLFYAWLIDQRRLIAPELLLNLLRDLVSIPLSTTGMNGLVNASSASGNGFTTAGTAGSGSLSLPPVAVFLLVKIFNIFLNIAPASEDRREQRELQELCHRVLESTAFVAASALEQPSWFRRTLQVRQTGNEATYPIVDTVNPPASLTPAASVTSIVEAEPSGLVGSVSSGNLMQMDGNQSQVPRSQRVSTAEPSPLLSRSSNLSLSVAKSQTGLQNDLTVQAMELLAEHMASFLDVVYRSDEKDRVPAFLTGILANIFPYLRVRTHSNSSCFTAASKLLASVSSYQYTRRSWRREVLDLFFEPMFFQMSLTALHSWNIIIDNLMTQDKNTFREALTRLSFWQPGALNLFANKEAENDLRAACLKKISYLIFASDPDQYAKSIPDLLERLTECLRLGQGIVPQVHSQMFLFSRTMIARMSAVQLTSMWPIIIPELMMVFKSMSHHLQQACMVAGRKLSDGKQQVTGPSEKEMTMYLSSCKFLATGLVIQEHKAPQFSFHQWIFVNGTGVNSYPSTQPGKTSAVPSFVPLVTELTGLLRTLESSSSTSRGIKSSSSASPIRDKIQGCLNLLAMQKLTNFLELAPFLYCLEPHAEPNHDGPVKFVDDTTPVIELALEAALVRDFLEPVVSR
ncbi:hypothetical protein EG68_06668, partial [Paragonimus skrjabini miyazakii]